MADDFFRQVSFNTGELDPALHGRRDVKNYYAALALAQNVVTTPAGPVQQRPGSTFIDYVRREIEAIDLGDATLTAPNGGDVADLAEGDDDLLTTSEDLGAEDHLILSVTFPEAVTVCAVDLVDYSVIAAAEPDPAPPPFTYPFPQDPDPYVFPDYPDVNLP